MPKVALKELVIDPTIQIRRSNHEPTIRRYEESFEKLPPVIAFKTKEGLLLADGFHRTAAAERLGMKSIEATIKSGTREDALEYAVIANTKNADPLSPDERDEGIRRLKQLHPDWSQVRIADVMSVSKTTVGAVMSADEVAKQVIVTGNRLSTSHFREIARAPKQAWQPLAKAADRRGWSRDATAQAVRNLKDERVPEARKNEILKGRSDPVVVTPQGEFAVPADVVSRRLGQMAANDATLAFQRALEALSKARLFRPDAITNNVDADTMAAWARELPGDISFLQSILEAAKRGRGKVRALGREG